ncbi:MAG: LLM class flavin-dependent oxidoreductase [Gammaproteobacteria bacterium]|nr:LLM class flavin-dependent oxidoreductase [Gammaproteobacteria bacterium]
MRFSTMIWPHSSATLEPVVELAQVADRNGFESVYIGDSQMIWNDVYVALGMCAVTTERVRLGTGVTNTVTRHPAVTANAIMSVNMASHGRAVLGIGAGDSAVRTAGMSPARLPVIRERVAFIRALLDGAEVDPLVTLGERREGTWGMVDRIHLEGAGDWGKLPIELACMGPKSAEAAGEICDGVIVDGHMGGNAEGVRATVEAVARGAAHAGRSVAGMRFVAAIDGAIEDDRGAALDQVRQTAARNIARKPYLPDCIGVEHADVVRNVTESYKFYKHLDLTAQHRKLIPDDVAMKCCIAGTPDDCIAKAKELAAAGITDIAVFITAQDLAASRRKLERFAREVMPYV